MLGAHKSANTLAYLILGQLFIFLSMAIIFVEWSPFFYHATYYGSSLAFFWYFIRPKPIDIQMRLSGQTMLLNEHIHDIYTLPQGILKRIPMTITVKVKVTAQGLPKKCLAACNSGRIPRMWTFLLTNSRVNTVYISAIWLEIKQFVRKKKYGRAK